MIVRKIYIKSILTKTGIEGYDYCLNPYVGCAHACRYCYATFIKRFTGHTEPWGGFVDAKINAPSVLERQLKTIRSGSVLIGTVTDPYQPLEKRYLITRRCLERLINNNLSISILTKSPLVIRDIDLIKKVNCSVGITITTDREDIKRIFEPYAPPLSLRLKALETLHKEGISTYAFIGPVLPQNPERLANSLAGKVNSVIIDRMNYQRKVLWIYRKYMMEEILSEEYFQMCVKTITEALKSDSIEVTVI
ncbi:MAG: radical SAM protein [Nitrospirota bacterium]